MNLCVVFLISVVADITSSTSVMNCLRNSDCSRSRTCLRGFCENPCMEICGPEALCAVMNHKAYCFCRDGTQNCISRKRLRECSPECEKNSICNTGIGYCECKLGYQGNPYRGCTKKCTSFRDCSSNEICSNGSCKNPCEEDCGINASCKVLNQTTVCSCPLGYTGNAFEICRPMANVLMSTKQEICAQCKENAKCITFDDVTSCVCPRGFVGNPYRTCMEICLSNTDCPANKICRNNVCTDPCKDVCGVNSKCIVESPSRKPKCICEDGFDGDPSRICTLRISIYIYNLNYAVLTRANKLETRVNICDKKCVGFERSRSAAPDDELHCLPKCGTNASCNTKYGICSCNIGHIGNPYFQCRKKCLSNSDCSASDSCKDGDCKDPCLDACGKNSICEVFKHTPTCRCPYGFSGDATKICKPQEVTTQSSFLEVDLCNFVTCGTNAECQVTGTEKCKCLRGYNGNPYKICFKKCRQDIDCSNEEKCQSGTCQNACIDGCGLNSICKAEDHIASCRCPDNYKGDPTKICFPNQKGVLINPSRIPCLKCICKAITGDHDIFACAEKSINIRYWAFAGEDLAGGENFRTTNTTTDFLTCMNDKICIFNTMNDYISRAMHRLSDIDCDGKITCADFFAVHKFGLTAQFNNSIFHTSEARSFDQCEDHGEKDISDNWTPKKCTEMSYVDILS